MSGSGSHLDDAFIERQRQRLLALRDQAESNQANADREERRLQEEWQEPRDMADRAADISRQDLDDAVERVSATRLVDIERALEKIDTGSYGYSDVSGEPIAKARLEARPEAVRTTEEESAAARRAR